MQLPVSTPPRPRFPRILRIFEPPPPVAVTVTDPAEVRSKYRSWQYRVLTSTIIGYASYYFVRKNLSVAMPYMEKDLGISKVQLGLFITAHGQIYGASKFISGYLGDKCNARAFMVAGLLASALLNILFGTSHAVLALGVIWMANGWVQGMGFPPCARLMTHWFPPKKLATKMSLWNVSHSLGGGLVLLLCGYLVPHGWQLCFFVPAGIALVCALYLWLTLPDTPESLGLPEVEGTHSDAPREMQNDFRALFLRHVFGNKYIWLLAFANFFVYIIRFAALDWGPTLLTQYKGFEIRNAAWMVFAFELSGLPGMLLAGWITDRLFGGRGMRTCVFYMALAGISLALFWKAAGHSQVLSTVFLCGTGFFVYGPQALVGIAAANLATKRAAATGSGFTGYFGYLSTLLSGWGLGLLVQTHGWDAAFAALLGVAAIGAFLFALGWNAHADGYETPATQP